MEIFKKRISTLIGMVIIFAVVIFAFGGVFAYEYYFIPKTQTLNIVVPTKVQILTSTLPITTIEKQNLSDLI